jgi:hypothetical protein
MIKTSHLILKTGIIAIINNKYTEQMNVLFIQNIEFLSKMVFFNCSISYSVYNHH